MFCLSIPHTLCSIIFKGHTIPADNSKGYAGEKSLSTPALRRHNESYMRRIFTYRNEEHRRSSPYFGIFENPRLSGAFRHRRQLLEENIRRKRQHRRFQGDVPRRGCRRGRPSEYFLGRNTWSISRLKSRSRLNTQAWNLPRVSWLENRGEGVEPALHWNCSRRFPKWQVHSVPAIQICLVSYRVELLESNFPI